MQPHTQRLRNQKCAATHIDCVTISVQPHTQIALPVVCSHTSHTKAGNTASAAARFVVCGSVAGRQVQLETSGLVACSHARLCSHTKAGNIASAAACLPGVQLYCWEPGATGFLPVEIGRAHV